MTFGEALGQAVREDKLGTDAWVASLIEQGYAAAHPDDGWVDRRKNQVGLAYPLFRSGKINVGDKIALGNYITWRSVVVRRVIETGMTMGPSYEFEAVELKDPE